MWPRYQSAVLKSGGVDARARSVMGRMRRERSRNLRGRGPAAQRARRTGRQFSLKVRGTRTQTHRRGKPDRQVASERTDPIERAPPTAERRIRTEVMSTYLSPIASSGESTPENDKDRATPPMNPSNFGQQQRPEPEPAQRIQSNLEGQLIRDNHKTLAEQFLTTSASDDELNYDQRGRFSKRSPLHELWASSFGQCASSSCEQSPCATKHKLNKKFKQILRSIPLVPTLVATTSIMTITLILCVLLLSDTNLAAALRSQGPPAAAASAESQGQVFEISGNYLSGGGGEDQQQPQALVMAAPAARAGDDESPAAERAHERAGEQSAAVMRRELINDLIVAQQQHRRHAQQQHRLPPQIARVRSAAPGGGATKRKSPAWRDDETATGDATRAPQSRGADLATKRAGEPTNGNLFDPLSALLFGAASQQQQEEQQPPQPQVSSAEMGAPLEQQAANSAAELAFLDGEPTGLLATAADGEHRPAHLRSSPLELELSPGVDQNTNYANSLVAATRGPKSPAPAGPQAARPASTASAAGGHRASNHERPFDVAQIQCNNTEEGFERFACPSPDFYGRYRCIEDRLFCDGYYDCPGGEDEERSSCMYYRLFISHIDILTNTFLTWMKNQNRQLAAAQQQQHFQQLQQPHQHQHGHHHSIF